MYQNFEPESESRLNFKELAVLLALTTLVATVLGVHFSNQLNQILTSVAASF